MSDKNSELDEASKKTELDYFSGMTEGIEEGLYLGIQLNRESRFNTKGNTLLKKIRRLKDLNLLKNVCLKRES